ncbi:protein kinase [Heliobacterium undosum]|uniref:Protein kinase n=1 Tax=Heliomicrobium undosum TaxID=121734 RepID=A0A845L072_9FIRM|nr:serine/threonine-protein kinase [Heliomicrobium undosum]MZP29827.1 protein kinase [Heliomicrobium undosum]
MAPKRCLGCFTREVESGACPACGYLVGASPESPLYLQPGTMLNERYQIGQVLGHGGFGITYIGYDNTLNTRVAVKEYLPRDLATRATGRFQVTAYTGELTGFFEYGLNKFLDEARALAQFSDHPCIVSVQDFFMANGTAYLVMRYLDGVTFKEYLAQQGGSIPVDTAIKIMNPVMDALREVHGADLLHRDISPDNIFITTTRQVKVLDFGAARSALGAHSRSLSVVLKPGYSPEEQYRSKGNQGPWTDVYAVAATLYRAITGVLPPEALDRANQDTLLRPAHFQPAISPQIEAALLKALAVRVTDRFQTMKEFQDALHGIPPVSVPNPSDWNLPYPNVPPGGQAIQPSPTPSKWLWIAATAAAILIFSLVILHVHRGNSSTVAAGTQIDIKNVESSGASDGGNTGKPNINGVNTGSKGADQGAKQADPPPPPPPPKKYDDFFNTMDSLIREMEQARTDLNKAVIGKEAQGGSWEELEGALRDGIAIRRSLREQVKNLSAPGELEYLKDKFRDYLDNGIEYCRRMESYVSYGKRGDESRSTEVREDARSFNRQVAALYSDATAEYKSKRDTLAGR